MSNIEVGSKSRRSLHRFNKALLWFVLTLSLGAAGCVSSAPVATTKWAMFSVKKGNLPEFQRALTTHERGVQGTEEGLIAIRQKLAGYSNVTIGPALLLSAKQGNQGYGHIGDIRRIYQTPISGNAANGSPRELIYNVLLSCKLEYTLTHHDAVPESCTTTIDANNVPSESCTGGDSEYDSEDLDESCLIREFKTPEKSVPDDPAL